MDSASIYGFDREILDEISGYLGTHFPSPNYEISNVDVEEGVNYFLRTPDGTSVARVTFAGEFLRDIEIDEITTVLNRLGIADKISHAPERPVRFSVVGRNQIVEATAKY